ncbi:hypothetical protein BDN71DRAFT_1586954 [Pleurotus eryngii]|uniref:F-box domain-containing protein n=1 Tax=Pleurotus eryngii TaxID=5323 RepID=A0A9P6A566_PLEER|nr:hypothetical protein BDN71DRAFT_1586954 [Pleurotus eryngii]
MAPRRNMIEGLSPEIIGHITKDLPASSQRSLSMASKSFRKRLEHQVFASVRLRTRGDTLRFINRLISYPSWHSFVKSLTIEIPAWEISLATSGKLRREKNMKMEDDPSVLATTLYKGIDYFSVLYNLERLIFIEGTYDDLSIIEIVLQAQFDNLQEFSYVSSSSKHPDACDLDTFLCRHPYIKKLELPPALKHHPGGLELLNLTSYTGSHEFFQDVVSTPDLKCAKLVVARKPSGNVLNADCIRSLWFSCSANLSSLECCLGKIDSSYDILKSIARFLPYLEHLKIKWDNSVMEPFDSKSRIRDFGSLLSLFSQLKSFDFEAYLPLQNEAPTVGTAEEIASYCPLLVSCGFLSECWTRDNVKQPWTQRHRWK